MKTLNLNIAKGLGKLILILTVLLISNAAYSQQSIKNYELKKFSQNLFQSTNEIISALNRTKEQKAFYESEIQLEDWMIELEKWALKMDSAQNSSESKPAAAPNKEVFIEESLELEDWMMDSSWIVNIEISDPELILENWMAQPKSWSIIASN